jgi:tetratricopeptide (TPR) repeat protein
MQRVKKQRKFDNGDRFSTQPAAQPIAWFGVAAIVAATTIAYWPALSGRQIWDDNEHVTRPELQSAEGLYRIWFDLGATQQYYPLLHSAFWLEHKLWGDSTLGYHLANLLEHLTATCFVYFILTRLRAPGALLAAAVFALHPVNVESVAWISEQKNTLSAIFYLSALLVYLQFEQSRRPTTYGLATLLFILGLMTKTVTATLPVALLVVLWWQRGKISWRHAVRPLIPWFVLGLGAGLFTAWVERTLIGAQGAEFQLSFAQRILLAGRAIWFYLANIVWPANLIFIYPRWQLDPTAWWQWLFPLAAAELLFLCWRARKKWRAPLAGTLFFVGTLFPVLGFFNVYPFIYSFIADHFQYLASLGIIAPLAAGLTFLAERLSRFSKFGLVRQQYSHLTSVLTALVLLVLVLLSWQQCRMYADAATLYQVTIDRNPDCWLAYDNLGVIAFNDNRIYDAIRLYQLSLQGNPNFAVAHYDLGIALAALNRDQEAIEQYQLAIEMRPRYAEAISNLGAAYFKMGSIKQAQESLEKAIAINPDLPEAHLNLALLHRETGQTKEAIQQYYTYLKLNPDDSVVRYRLGLVQLQIGDVSAAIRQFQASLQINPDDAQAHSKMGIALAKAGSMQAAIEQYREAIRLNSELIEAHANLAVALAAEHRTDEAIRAARKAIVLGREQNKPALVQQLNALVKTLETQSATDGGARK